jgi:2-polyprenyl-6-methoxyphenol hydroxylase-like FAD-dependent oxidoreductase
MNGRVVIVGGSIVGLSSALALARVGADVTVLERSDLRALDIGGGLGVDVELIQHVTGVTSAPPVCRGVDRDTTAWQLLRDWLEDSAAAVDAIELRRDVNVTTVVDDDDGDGDGDGAVVVSSTGEEWRAELVVGADGVHSTVRPFVDPENPRANYAGFVLWRAMVSEELVKGVAKLPGPREPSREYYEDHYRLVTYPVPGPRGETRVGERRLNLVWYDTAREDLLRARGLLEGVQVRGSLLADALPAELGAELQTIAQQTWPSPWAEALEIAIERRFIFGTPVAEYMPERLVNGHIAIAGDAAHAASPMVGGGFSEGLGDAERLAKSFASSNNPVQALASYEKARLGPARRHVAASQRATNQYLAWARSS